MPWLTPFRRYAIALALVALATLVRWLLGPLIGTRFPFLLQFLALLWAARFLGIGPAIAGLALGTSPMVFGVEFIVRPPRELGWGFWLATAGIYSFCIFLFWGLDRQRRISELLT